MSEHRTNATITVDSGDSLDVRHFAVTQTMSKLFTVTITAVSDNADIDFEAVAGQVASFTLHGHGGPRTWRGLCSEFHLLQVEDSGLSTYHVVIVPRLWLASQRRNHRIFQIKSELDIALQLLGEWGVAHEVHVRGTYKSRKYRVQYGESDFAFFSRMLEEAGISFFFEDRNGETICVVSDAPQANPTRDPPIAFRDQPTVADREHVTDLRVSRHVRPGTLTLRDNDYRRPASYKLLAGAAQGAAVESKLESFHYTPGAFLFASDKGEDTTHADDKGKHRTDEDEGKRLAEKRLAAEREDAGVITFRTNVVDLAPGTVLSVLDHPQRQVADGKRLLVVESRIEGRVDEEMDHRCELRSADAAYHPPLDTPKPKVNGVESATVVGPAGEEIHTDEFGRVRVHFHWDRESQMDDNSSCWIHVNQPWGGSGYGGTNLPRIGQEVIVDFLGGDPDRPMIMGRVFTNLQKTPYGLPDNKTQSGWKSSSSPSTGGYNEIMFEDKAGGELLRMQAEKDLRKLVKNDEHVEIGQDRNKKIGRHEAVQIGGDRSTNVGQNVLTQVVGNVQEMFGQSHTKLVGQNHAVTVGGSSTKQVGQIDSTVVGKTKVVSIAVAGEGGVPPDATHYILEDGKLHFDDGKGASITIEQGKITLKAANGIHIAAETGDVLIEGKPKIKLNP